MQHPQIQRWIQQGRQAVRPNDLIDIFCVSDRTIRRWADEGLLDYYRPQRVLLIGLDSANKLWQDSYNN